MLRGVATLSLLFALFLVAHAQSGQAVIRLKNESFLALTVKLVGPTPKAAALRGRTMHTFRVQPGQYRFFYRFHTSSPATDYFLGTEPFLVRAEDGIVTALANDGFNDKGSATDRRYKITPAEFAQPGGWPEGVKVEDHVGFSVVKVLGVVGELDMYEEDAERPRVTALARNLINRRVQLDVLGPLRKQGFTTTYAWLGNRERLPERFIEPTLLVTYEESTGRQFQIGSGVNGVDVSLRFSLYDAGDLVSDPIWEQSISGSNDPELRVNILNPKAAFRANSLLNLQSNLELFHLDLSNWKSKP